MDAMGWTAPEVESGGAPVAPELDPAGAAGLPPAPGADFSEGRAGYEVFLAAVEDVLDRVDRALSRLDDGAYGSCAVCGQPIADSDLASTPTTSHCERHLPLDATS